MALDHRLWGKLLYHAQTADVDNALNSGLDWFGHGYRFRELGSFCRTGAPGLIAKSDEIVTPVVGLKRIARHPVGATAIKRRQATSVYQSNSQPAHNKQSRRVLTLLWHAVPSGHLAGNPGGSHGLAATLPAVTQSPGRLQRTPNVDKSPRSII